MRVSIISPSADLVQTDDGPYWNEQQLELEAIQQSASRLGWNCNILFADTQLNLLNQQIDIWAPQLLFNAASSPLVNFPQRAKVAELLAKTGIPVIGQSYPRFESVHDKHWLKVQLRSHGMPTADWYSSGEALYDFRTKLPAEFILKSRFDHGSWNINETSFIHPESVPKLKMHVDAQAVSWGRYFLAEKYIEGREITLSLLNDPGKAPTILPIVELDFGGLPRNRRRIVSDQAKWNVDSLEFRSIRRNFNFSELDRPVVNKISKLAQQAWELFQLGPWATIDFKIDRIGQAFILDINAAMSLSPHGIFATSLREGGISLDEALVRIAAGV